MSPAKILIVDDEVAIVDLLMNHFEFDGYVVAGAYDGESGLEKALSERPDLIFLDINMPKIDGLEVCRRLKENDATSSIPIIILSAFAQPTYVERGLALGAAAFMIKPFSLDEINAAVAKLLPAPGRPPA